MAQQPVGKVVTGAAGPAIRVQARPYGALSTDVRRPSNWDTPFGQAMKAALIRRGAATLAAYGTLVGARLAVNKAMSGSFLGPKHAREKREKADKARRAANRSARAAGAKGSGTGGAGRG